MRARIGQVWRTLFGAGQGSARRLPPLAGLVGLLLALGPAAPAVAAPEPPPAGVRAPAVPAAPAAPGNPAAPTSSATPAPGDRIGRVTAALARSPLFVDQTLVDLVPTRTRAALRLKLRGITNLYVVVLPSLPGDESGGDRQVLLHRIAERLGRDGAYVLADQDGAIHVLLVNIPKRVTLSPALAGAGAKTPLGTRLAQVIDVIRVAPPGRAQPLAAPVPTVAPQAYDPTVLVDFDHRPGTPWWVTLLWIVIGGPLFGLALYGGRLGVARLRTHRG